MVTVVTTAGRFSSPGGWNGDSQRLRINVQTAPPQPNAISVTDPVDLKWMPGNNLYVLSRSTATIIEYNSSGTAIRSLSGIGTTPNGLDVDSAGNVYVAVTGDNQVKKFTPTIGSFQLDTTFNGTGYIGRADKGTGTGNSEFNAPYDVAVSPSGQGIAVSDSGNSRIQQFGSDGTFLSSFGQAGSGIGQFSAPKGLTYDGMGYLYIVDSGNSRICLALPPVVIGTSGAAGTALGQFQSPLNLSANERGIYVADAGNNRIQEFDPIQPGHGGARTPFVPRGSLSSQLSPPLNQPASAAAVADLLAESLYIADTGNNRVVLVSLPGDEPLTAAWNSMVAHAGAGDISGAISSFSSQSAEGYRAAFLTLGASDVASLINQIGPLTPVFIRNDTAEYYFEQTVDGQLLLFPVEFVKENGVWKIEEF